MLFIWSFIMFSVIGKLWLSKQCDTCEQNIEPNQHEVYAEVGSNVLLSCNYSSADSLLWYKQSPGSTHNESTHPRLSVKLNEDKTHVDLEISSTEVSDSALYYCALRPTGTGNPETLWSCLLYSMLFLNIFVRKPQQGPHQQKCMQFLYELV
uniref:Ig-like domain-containing protein n=1 Tax=Salmo trutta TaxID=8032 RepID=A0A674F548_SALTR